MHNFKILIVSFLGMFYVAQAQHDNTNKMQLTMNEQPEVIAKNISPNTVVYSYRHKNEKRKIENPQAFKESEIDSNVNNVVFEYPIMRADQGAVLPFEFTMNDSKSTKDGIEAEEYYFNSLMEKPELNKIIYQDLETTRTRLNNAGIFDAQDLNYFDMPLIAKIVGAGVLITAKIKVNEKRKDSPQSNTISATEEYNIESTFNIYNQVGSLIFTKSDAPIITTTKNSYQVMLSHFMKQTPYYHKL
ncbi:hypothetical protein JQC67_17395 [Aurantibacter crassamenti]|uniref:hypothetical protein n=1 Tax=Aurantibacter crassamenti TaxID=1837375 RepID=UPI00193A3FC4|nr:hypothetical protein [Aurantibacter crassamenti]MBM1107934.1 hypothetical protein [Aurantibacter crassamenti]